MSFIQDYFYLHFLSRNWTSGYPSVFSFPLSVFRLSLFLKQDAPEKFSCSEWELVRTVMFSIFPSNP